MALAARERIEALLRERKLDTTLTSARPLHVIADDQYVAPTGIAALDAHLGGGLPRGQISEVVGPQSSGRTSVTMSALARAAARGELTALVDTFDTFDPASAHACGFDLGRLLWVRGRSAFNGSSSPRAEGESGPAGAERIRYAGTRVPDALHQLIDRALKSFNLILQAGGFGLVVLDLADAPPAAIKRLSFTTWLRLQRPIEGTSTACAIVGCEPVARSAGGVTIALHQPDGPKAPWSHLFPGLDVEARIGRARGITETCRFHLGGLV